MVMQAKHAEVPVRLASAAIVVDAAAGMAQTTIDMTFHNPNARVLEGRLEFPLQPGQSVVGFALDIDGRMRDAVPVEKERARQVFESIERRQVDPGLLEQTQGEFFRVRVYPLPPRGERRVRVIVSEALRRDTAGWSTTVPLQFARELPEVQVTVRSAEAPVVTGTVRQVRVASSTGEHRIAVGRGNTRPGQGITLQFPGAAAPRFHSQRHGDGTYFVAEVPAGGAAVERRLPGSVGLLWDASMSGARRAHDLEFALLDAYFRKAGTVDVQLVRLRDVADPVERFQVRNGDWSALRRALEGTVYDGATRPDGWRSDPGVGEYLLFGDGLFNYGASGFPSLGPAQRLFAVHAGGGGDSARLQALAEASGGAFIGIRDSAGLAAAERELLHDAPRLTTLEGRGVTDLVAASIHARDGVFRVAGRLAEAQSSLRLQVTDAAGNHRSVDVPLDTLVEGHLAARVWASYRLAALQSDPRRHSAAMAGLGKDFGMVTPQTSLLVLDDVEDYVRYDIQPPAELREAFARLQGERERTHSAGRQQRLDAIAEAWNARVEWWEAPFPKDGRGPSSASAESEEPPVVFDDPSPVDTPAPSPAPPASAAPASLDRIEVTGSRVEEGDVAAAGTSITLAPWRSDAPAARRLRQLPADQVYPHYLDERARNASGTAFYLDVADVLFEKKQPALALRVLSNLAEMDLENRHVLRVLGYRLMQAGHPQLAVDVLERVQEMGGEEPQTYRDLGLAYAAAGRPQEAIERLYEVVEGEWDPRFSGVSEIALAELNGIVAASRSPLDTSFVDRRLLRNLPLALRTVLSWDSDNSDMDLWVTDPDGERAYYGNRLTYQGGRMSQDLTGGYGPKEFALRKARRGTYKVEANFFGDRQQLVTGATTLQLWLSTNFGQANQHDRAVTLRLTDVRETVLVGEFEVE
ncbi:VIT domain-containing protein [Luteimonas terricola]|nr:VIT domain-containing protein [Luteimonas terricola]